MSECCASGLAFTKIRIYIVYVTFIWALVAYIAKYTWGGLLFMKGHKNGDLPKERSCALATTR